MCMVITGILLHLLFDFSYSGARSGYLILFSQLVTTSLIAISLRKPDG